MQAVDMNMVSLEVEYMYLRAQKMRLCLWEEADFANGCTSCVTI
jgi:hypothetical protein